MIENDSNYTYEEPGIYYSNSSNFGVCAIFSENKSNSYNQRNMSFIPDNNNNSSLSNTIMLPFIKNEELIENKDNYYNYKDCKKNINSNINRKIKAFSRKDNTIINAAISKDDNNICEDKPLTNRLIKVKEKNNIIKKKENNEKQKKNLEKNPFFFGKTFTLRKYQDNIKLKSKVLNNESKNNSNYDNEKSENDIIFRKEASKSVFCNESKGKKTIKEDDISENIIIKSQSIKKDSVYLKIEKAKEKEKSRTTKQTSDKRKIYKQAKNNKKGKEKDKDENLKIKKDKVKLKSNNNEKQYNGASMPNNNSNRNSFNDKNKYNIDEKHNDYSEKKSEKKNIKRYNYNKYKTQRFDNNRNKKKSIKETKDLEDIKDLKDKKDKINENINKKIISNVFRTFQQEKGMNILKKYIIKKEKDNNSYYYFEKTEKEEFKDKMKNSKKELNKRDSDKTSKNKNNKNEKIRRGKSVEKIDKHTLKIIKYLKDLEKDPEEKKDKNKGKKLNNFSDKLLNLKEKEKEKDNNKESENNHKINKCFTADLNKNKNFMMFDKKIKTKSLFNSQKKMNHNISVINLFGKDNINKNKKIDFNFAIKNNLEKPQFNIFSRDKFTNTELNNDDYLKYTLDCMELILDLDINKQTRLKNKINFNFPKPKKNKIKKKIALFDLDETLVHCTGDTKIHKEKYQHEIEIKLPGKQAVKVGINIRPYWKQTLNLIKKHYYIVIYTASHQAYADSVLDFMDPKKKYFKYRLYRNNCSLINIDGSKFYVKDLDIFNEYYDLKDIVIIDNSVLSFAYHLYNGIPIVPYFDEDKDGSLYVVGLYLIHIFSENDLREANKKQINLDSFLEEARKKKVDQIEEESYSKEDDKKENNNNDNFDNNDNNDNKNKNNNNDNYENSKIGALEKLEKRLSRKTYDLEKEENEKRLFLMKKYSSHFLNKMDIDFTQKKLKSKSKLINMYYEVKEQSIKNEDINDFQNEINKDENFLNNEDKNNNSNIIFNNVECDCKSDPGYIHLEQNNLSENESSDDEKADIIFNKAFRIINEFSLQKKDKEQYNSGERTTKNSWKTTLGYIRSNFYNKFNI